MIQKNRKLDIDSAVKEEILSFLSNTYSTSKDNQYSIYKYKDKWIVDSKRSLVVIDYNISYLTNGLFEFGDINGDFDCSYCSGLKSLKGLPNTMRGSIICLNCKNLTSLEGCPEELNYLDCSYCESLQDFTYGPKKTRNGFKHDNIKNK